jgi:hypothetical protein
MRDFIDGLIAGYCGRKAEQLAARSRAMRAREWAALQRVWIRRQAERHTKEKV